jgi:hypothetical protein
MMALMVTVWVMGVEAPWLVPVAVKVMGKVPVVMGMKWSEPQAVVAVARIASRARDRTARGVVWRFRARPIRDRNVSGKNTARTILVSACTVAIAL